MKKVNYIAIATIVATFVISMFAFQPITTEASNGVMPLATSSPQKIVTKRKTSTGVWEHSNIPPGNKVKPSKNPTSQKIEPRKSKGFTEVTGLDIQVERRKHSRRKSAQYNPKEIGIDKIKARKSKSSIIFDDTDGAEKVSRKQPRKRGLLTNVRKPKT